MLDKKWQATLTVDKRIVGLLSARTYEDFPGAIREMVSNAFDADATEVNIKIDRKADYIEVTDNGNGMTPDDFKFYLRIAGQQRGRPKSPLFERPRIGRFGIGFLATFPFADEVIIISTARRSDTRFEASIPAKNFMKDDRRVVDIEEIEIDVQEFNDSQYIEQHGTTLRLSGLSELVKLFYVPRNEKIHARRNTIKKWTPSEKLKWMLQEDLPLDYSADNQFENPFADLGPAGIKVTLNGEELFRNVIATDVLGSGIWTHKDIKCMYYGATNWKTVTPDEAKHIKVRINNVGIGDRTSFGVGIEGRAYSRLHWITGEIRIIEGFDKLLTIDRKRFAASPEFDEFREHFRTLISRWAHQVENIAEAQRDIKRQLDDSNRAEVGSKSEIIDRNINKLESRGFEVVKRPASSVSKKDLENDSPVKVNTKERKIEIIEDHPMLLDTEKVLNRLINVRYESWDPDGSDFAAARRSEDGVIEINEKYPLFRKKQYGEVFKKTFILLILLADEAETPDELAKNLMYHLQTELKNI